MKHLLKDFNNSLFNLIHSNRLIYNTCWEDPRIDRALLQLNNHSRVVMITSAGCNALDYLLDAPREIHAVDMNARQNALLHLKLALIRGGDYDGLFQMFGNGHHPGYKQVYRALENCLPAEMTAFWKKSIRYFNGRYGPRRSFYYHGTSGEVAWLVVTWLSKTRRKLRPLLSALLEARNLTEQERIYHRIEPLLWSPLFSRLAKQPLLMAMLGVPTAQIELIRRQYDGGLEGYLRDKLRHVFTRVPIHDNYFWRVYLTGSYTPQCCPNYLKRSHFKHLHHMAHRIQTHTSTLSAFLQQHPAAYSHYVLLDHQDWMAGHAHDLLEAEWRLILLNSRPGTRILMRSAGLEIRFIPDGARRQLRFFPELTAQLHQQDRVGTYGCLLMAEVV